MGTDADPRWSFLLSVEAQRLFCQICNTIQFLFGARKECPDGIRDRIVIFREINEVGECFQWVVDLMGDSGCQPAHRGNLLGSPEGLLHPLPLSYIARHFRSADNTAVVILNRRNRQGNIEPLASFGDSYGLKMLNALTAS